MGATGKVTATIVAIDATREKTVKYTTAPDDGKQFGKTYHAYKANANVFPVIEKFKTYEMEWFESEPYDYQGKQVTSKYLTSAVEVGPNAQAKPLQETVKKVMEAVGGHIVTPPQLGPLPQSITGMHAEFIPRNAREVALECASRVFQGAMNTADIIGVASAFEDYLKNGRRPE